MGVSYGPKKNVKATNYILRVNDDNGEVIDEEKINDFYNFVRNNDIYNDLFFAHTHKYSGYTKDSSEKIQKIYDLSSGNRDYDKESVNNQPTFVQNGILTESNQGLQRNYVTNNGTIPGLESNGYLFLKVINHQNDENDKTLFQARDIGGVPSGLFSLNTIHNINNTFDFRISDGSATDTNIGFNYNEDYNIVLYKTNSDLIINVNSVNYNIGNVNWLGEVVFESEAITMLYNSTVHGPNSNTISSGLIIINGSNIVESNFENVFNLM